MQLLICLAQLTTINLKLALAGHINDCEIQVACTTHAGNEICTQNFVTKPDV